jgi:predicted transcriptional regulator
MSEHLAEQVIRPTYEQIVVGSMRHSRVQEILRRAQEVEDEITERRSIGVTAHVRSGVS